MFKKFMALTSAVIMLLSFAACGDKNDETTTTEAGKEVAATEVVTNAEGEAVTDKKGEIVTVVAEDKTDKNGEEKTEKEDETTTEKGDKTTKKDDETTEKTTKNDGDKTTKPSTTKVTTTEKKDTKPSSKAEIIDYYNKAVNKVKSSAKSVVRTYDNSTNYNGIVEAGGLSKIGKLLMDTFLKENHDKVTFSGSEKIVASFPVETKKTSNIPTSAVKTATCTDKGSYYEITLVANCSDSKPDVNPARGGGIVGTMFNILEVKDITDATDKAGALLELSGIKFSYMGGTLTARIDKETGNMTYLNTKLPMVLSMDKARAALITVDNAKIGLQFENKWEINW